MTIQNWLIAHCRLGSTENEVDTATEPTDNPNTRETLIWTQTCLVRVDSHHSTQDTRNTLDNSNESRESDEETASNRTPDTWETQEDHDINPSIITSVEALLEDSESDEPSYQETASETLAYIISPIEQQTIILHQDLISLLIHHRTAATTTSTPSPSSLLAAEEMETLMSHYENSLSSPLYAGLSTRIRLSILYTAYVTSDRTFFPRSPFAALTFSYLGPKQYLASRLRRQKVSSEMLMVFQNLQTVIRELEAVTWGRRRYLRRLRRYPEVVVRTIWMLDPTVTHRWDGPLIL